LRLSLLANALHQRVNVCFVTRSKSRFLGIGLHVRILVRTFCRAAWLSLFIKEGLVLLALALTGALAKLLRLPLKISSNDLSDQTLILS